MVWDIADNPGAAREISHGARYPLDTTPLCADTVESAGSYRTGSDPLVWFVRTSLQGDAAQRGASAWERPHPWWRVAPVSSSRFPPSSQDEIPPSHSESTLRGGGEDARCSLACRPPHGPASSPREGWGPWPIGPHDRGGTCIPHLGFHDTVAQAGGGSPGAQPRGLAPPAAVGAGPAVVPGGRAQVDSEESGALAALGRATRRRHQPLVIGRRRASLFRLYAHIIYGCFTISGMRLASTLEHSAGR